MVFMDVLFPIIIAILVLGIGVLAVSYLLANKDKLKKPENTKDRTTLMREANRKLAQDPHNPHALNTLANIYFTEHQWAKAFPLYNLMLDIIPAHPEIDTLTTGLRQGICALQLNSPADAFKGLSLARAADQNNPDVNYYLGKAFYQNGVFDKAIPLFKKAIITKPDDIAAFRLLGICYSKTHKSREALPYLKRSLDDNPEDKECLFNMAFALAETNSIERALKIFCHLRPDPEYGPQSCLQAGILHSNINSPERALQDFEIGLRHQDLNAEIAVEMKYRMAQVLIKMQNISDALKLLKEVQVQAPTYKDVSSLVAQFSELNQNKNLQTYLMATNSDFVTLCKQIVLNYYPNTRARIIDLISTSENTEAIAEINTPSWEDIVIFRFYRTSSSVGELYLRDFHTKIRDTKAGRGICFSAGAFSDEARRFIDGRPIELIERHELTKLLARIPSSSVSATGEVKIN